MRTIKIHHLGRLVLIMVFVVALFPSVSHASPNDDWVSIHVTKVAIGDNNWGWPVDGHAEFRLLMIATNESGYQSHFAYPGDTTLDVEADSLVQLGQSGLSLRVPKYDDRIQLVLVGVDSDDQLAVFNRGTDELLGFAAEHLADRLKEIWKVVEAGKTFNFWSWLIDKATDEGLSTIVDYLRQTDEIGEAMLTLHKKDHWSADGRPRKVTALNGAITFTYEVRIAPNPQSSQPSNQQLTIRPYNSQRDTNVYCADCTVPGWADMSQPGHTSWNVMAPGNTPILVGLGWCASDRLTLNQNWLQMGYGLIIDGVPADMRLLPAQYQVLPDRVCYIHNGVISGWGTGRHTYQWVQRISRAINDGWQTYPAGSYSVEFSIDIE